MSFLHADFKNKINKGENMASYNQNPNGPKRRYFTEDERERFQKKSQERFYEKERRAPKVKQQKAYKTAPQQMQKKQLQKQVKKRSAKKIIATVLAVVVIAVCLFGGYLLLIVNGIEKDKLNVSNLGATAQISSKVKNIALFGVDNDSDTTRSDTIIIMSLDYEHNKIKMTSILRDSYVKIDGYGYDKLNHAYAYGGPELAINTLNKNFDMDITDYATVRFDQMAEIVDAVGGVEINVKKYEVSHLNKVIKNTAKKVGATPVLIKKEGKQTLNGIQAVSYSRVRKVGNGDYERTERQRKVLAAVFAKVKKANPLQYPGIIKKLLPHVSTSLETGAILKAGTLILRNAETENARIPTDKDLEAEGAADGRYISGIWYMAYDLDKATDVLHKFIYQDIHPDPDSKKKDSSD